MELHAFSQANSELIFAQTLNVRNLASTNAGDYQVVISSPYGSVTSAVATVSVALPPLQAAQGAGGVALLSLDGVPGSSYILQTAAGLVPPVNWRSLATNVVDATGNCRFTDTNASVYPASFYRLKLD